MIRVSLTEPLNTPGGPITELFVRMPPPGGFTGCPAHIDPALFNASLMVSQPPELLADLCPDDIRAITRAWGEIKAAALVSIHLSTVSASRKKQKTRKL